jgi:2-polyprenyl-6-methoxyphenol hydroxylase-like FAD-dependent oxidoreductase
MTTDEIPVLIVGGGPVGLALALELDYHGVPVVLLEPRTTVSHERPRAKTTSARTMEHLRRWGVARALRAAAPIPVSWSDRVTFVTTLTGDEVTHIDSSLGLRTPEWMSPETAQQVSQGIVEEVLRAAVRDRPGIDARFGWRAVEVQQEPASARVTALNGAGEVAHLVARWVVGADGPRSLVRSAMRARYEGESGGRPNVNITFRAPGLLRAIPHPPSIHYWVLDPASPGVIGPLDLSGTWWAISTGTESIANEIEATSILHGLIGAPIELEVLATDPWQARMLLADEYRDGRLLLVGDAAHQNPPWGGHGFNTGIGDAVNLGWKLAAVLHGWAPESLIDTYGQDRRPIEQQTIELARTNMQSLAIDLDPHGDPRTILRAKIPEFHADGLVFGYGYRPESTRQAPTPSEYIPILAPGNRLPHELLRGRPIFDLLGREFTVLAPHDQAVALFDAAKNRGIPVTHVERPGPIVLVRPDQHVSWTGERVENPDLILDAAISSPPGFGGHDAVR